MKNVEIEARTDPQTAALVAETNRTGVQMTNGKVEQPIRDFIATRLLYSNEGFNYPDEASLLREGIIDSLGVVELVEFLQNHFQLKIEQQEVRPDNFDSVARLAAYVRRKSGVAA